MAEQDITGVGAAEPAPVAIDETDRLIASDKVTGRVAYAVMSFGGFLGLGERYYPLPWQALTYDPGRGGYIVDIDPDTLDRAPSFAAGEDPWGDPEHRRNVFGFYGFNYGL